METDLLGLANMGKMQVKSIGNISTFSNMHPSILENICTPIRLPSTVQFPADLIVHSKDTLTCFNTEIKKDLLCNNFLLKSFNIPGNSLPYNKYFVKKDKDQYKLYTASIPQEISCAGDHSKIQDVLNNDFVQDLSVNAKNLLHLTTDIRNKFNDLILDADCIIKINFTDLHSFNKTSINSNYLNTEYTNEQIQNIPISLDKDIKLLLTCVPVKIKNDKLEKFYSNLFLNLKNLNVNVANTQALRYTLLENINSFKVFELVKDITENSPNDLLAQAFLKELTKMKKNLKIDLLQNCKNNEIVKEIQKLTQRDKRSFLDTFDHMLNLATTSDIDSIKLNLDKQNFNQNNFIQKLSDFDSNQKTLEHLFKDQQLNMKKIMDNENILNEKIKQHYQDPRSTQLSTIVDKLIFFTNIQQTLDNYYKLCVNKFIFTQSLVHDLISFAQISSLPIDLHGQDCTISKNETTLFKKCLLGLNNIIIEKFSIQTLPILINGSFYEVIHDSVVYRSNENYYDSNSVSSNCLNNICINPQLTQLDQCTLNILMLKPIANYCKKLKLIDLDIKYLYKNENLFISTNNSVTILETCNQIKNKFNLKRGTHTIKMNLDCDYSFRDITINKHRIIQTAMISNGFIVHKFKHHPNSFKNILFFKDIPLKKFKPSGYFSFKDRTLHYMFPTGEVEPFHFSLLTFTFCLMILLALSLLIYKKFKAVKRIFNIVKKCCPNCTKTDDPVTNLPLETLNDTSSAPLYEELKPNLGWYIAHDPATNRVILGCKKNFKYIIFNPLTSQAEHTDGRAADILPPNKLVLKKYREALQGQTLHLSHNIDGTISIENTTFVFKNGKWIDEADDIQIHGFKDPFQTPAK